MNITTAQPRCCRGSDSRPRSDRAEEAPEGLCWTGQWVADRLEVSIEERQRIGGVSLADLVGLAVRRNPRRAHLLVSTVLGKHVPTDPRLVYGAGRGLGGLVLDALSGHNGPWVELFERLLAAALTGRLGAAQELRDTVVGQQSAPTVERIQAVVVGYAETATALGHAVADALSTAMYLHSTRRHVAGVVPYGGFEEEHSHATSHVLLPVPANLLDLDVPLVLVDDELSTGATVMNTIRALHAVRARRRYVIATLVDLRDDTDRAQMAALAADLGARIDVVAVVSGRIGLPRDVLPRGRTLVEETMRAHDTSVVSAPPPVRGQVRRVDLGWPVGLPDGGRHGFAPAHRARLESELPALAARLAATMPAKAGDRILVLGFEELMYAPLRLAEALADSYDAAGADVEVRYSSTTRSPVLPVDDPGYAIRTSLVFPAHDGPAGDQGERYAYNVAAGGDAARGFAGIICVVDDTADTEALATADGPLAQLAHHTDVVLLAVIPAYRPEDASPQPMFPAIEGDR